MSDKYKFKNSTTKEIEAERKKERIKNQKMQKHH